MRKNSIKNVRINQEVQRELSSLIMREVKDPRIHMMTSITRAEVAPDLKTAKIYVSVLGTDDELVETVKGLKRAAPFLRSQLAKSMNMRNTPELNFIADPSIAYGVMMTKRLESFETENADTDIAEGSADTADADE